MSARLKITLASSFAIPLLLAGTAMSGQAAGPAPAKGISPALCGPGDIREPGIQGEVPAGQTAKYNCGVRLVGQLPRTGNVQGVGKCAYVRNQGRVYVIDVSDPAKPVEVGSVPVQMGSETMRVVVTGERAVLVSGSSVYDIKDCLKPVLAGEIKWPPLNLGAATTGMALPPGMARPPGMGGPGGPGGAAGAGRLTGPAAALATGSRMLPHDIRINHAGTRVYASFGLWEADITNLKDPDSWKVTDHRCELAAQQPGPWQEIHRVSLKASRSLCADSATPSPRGTNHALGASSLHASLLWPTLSHSPDTNSDGTRVYVGDQAGGSSGLWAGPPKMRIIDMTSGTPKVIGLVDGPGHSLDWLRSGSREYVLHSNEGGTGGIMGQPERGDTCKPYPRPTGLGWGFEVIVSDVTVPAKSRNVSMLRLAINDPEYCSVRKASGRDPTVAYHMIDNPMNPKFAAVSFGNAGLRIFDIRQPTRPSEVAYFNHGPLSHAGVSHYDAARGLLYVPGGSGFWVLEIAPQVRARLGL